jgi:HD superfamily phosphohydrolase YqeK
MIAIIPDVHGRQFWTKIKDKVDDFDKIIFLGDYLDPYTRYEGITCEQALNNFKELLEFANDHKDRVILLYGNHDLFYIDEEKECCRHDYLNQGEIRKLFRENSNLFQFAYKQDGCLFTHAGVTSEWLLQNNFKIDEEHIVSFLNSNPNELWQIGASRGGFYDFGSPVWSCAYGDWPFCNNPYNLIQIFGHSQQQFTGSKKSFSHDTCHCIDSREIFVWNNGELKVFNNG